MVSPFGPYEAFVSFHKQGFNIIRVGFICIILKAIHLNNHEFEYKCVQSKPGPNKTGFNLMIFHFDISGKLSIIRCDK